MNSKSSLHSNVLGPVASLAIWILLILYDRIIVLQGVHLPIVRWVLPPLAVTLFIIPYSKAFALLHDGAHHTYRDIYRPILCLISLSHVFSWASVSIILVVIHSLCLLGLYGVWWNDAS